MPTFSPPNVSKKVSQSNQAPHNLSDEEARALLQEAKERLPIPRLWRHFGFPGEVSENRSVRSPFRDGDLKPSFSIFDDGREYKDHGTGDTGDSYDFYQRATKLDSKTAYRPFVELAGLGDRLATKARVSAKTPEAYRPASRPRPLIREANPPEFAGWQDCVDCARFKMKPLEERRGLSHIYVLRLLDAGEIGYYKGHWATPVKHKGRVVAIHYQVEVREPGGKACWYYEPRLSDLGVAVSPYGFLIDREDVQVAHCSESTWDSLSLDDRVGISFSGEAIFCTRGAQNTKLLCQIPPRMSEIFLWPQNDSAGQKWLNESLKALSTRPTAIIRVARVPERFKDLNEWTLAGADATLLREAMEKAEVLDPAAQEAVAPFQYEEQQNGSRKRLLLPGHSLAHYARREINHDNTLLGKRWLCRTNGAIIVAPSGIGKSSCSLQAAILWGCGKPAFAIKPNGALRVLILQAEDDEDDTTEMCRMLDSSKLELTDSDRQLVERNTQLERVSDCTGNDFLEVLDGYLEQRHFDTVILNPLSAYVGDPSDTREMADFLRRGLNRLLMKFNIGIVLIHHTPKTNFQKEKNLDWFDWMYVGAGVAGLTNWARAILAIWPTEIEGTFRFIAAKRSKRIGWREREYYFAHSDADPILWQPATEEQIAAAKTVSEQRKAATRQSKQKGPEMLLCYMSEGNWLSSDAISALANGEGQPGISSRRVPAMLETLVELKKAERKEEPRPRTQPLKLYRKRPTGDVST